MEAIVADYERLGGDPPCWQHLFEADGDSGGPPRPRVRVRRVYEPPLADDGFRVLVDRLWPRGLSKDSAHLDQWLRDLAPSDELRRWYGHDPARWDEFARRYRAELAQANRPALLAELAQRAATEPVTLLCAARDANRSNAEVIRQVLLERLGSASEGTSADSSHRG